MSDTPRKTSPAAFLSGGLLALLLVGSASPARAQTQDETLEIEASAHADTLELAYRTLEAHIERSSAAATSWGGDTPPAATGWDPDWTLRGLGGRYCDDMLVVYAVRITLKGVGSNQRTVRMAPHVRATREGRVYPPLHWLASGIAEGDLGRASVTLPACMATLPTDRVALAGRVVDPWSVTTQKVVRREQEDRVCPSGQHGTGQTWERPWTQDFNGRGEPIGMELAGSWGIKVDRCRADYTVAELYIVACPDGIGEQVWRRHRTVTSDGETFIVDPIPVSSTCTVSPPPPPPSAVINSWDAASYEYRTVGCPFTHTGSGQRERRTVTRSYESTEWPWDSTPTQRLVDVGYSNWITVTDNCAMVVADGQNGGGQNGGGGRDMGIDVNNDGIADFGNAQEATDAGWTGSQMSVGIQVGTFSRPTAPTQANSIAPTTPAQNQQGGGGGGGHDRPGGHQDGFNGNTGPGGFGGASGA